MRTHLIFGSSHCGSIRGDINEAQRKGCIKLKRIKLKQTWVTLSNGGIFQGISFGEKEMKVEIGLGQIVGPAFFTLLLLVCCAKSIAQMYAIVVEVLLCPSFF